MTQRNTMSKVVTDTSFIVALMDRKDQHHKKALSIYNEVKKKDVEIICMDCIVNEIYSVMARKLIERGMSRQFSKVADLIGTFLKDIDVINAYQYLHRFHSKVVDLMKQTEGKLNYHDALIALCCRQIKGDKIISLDSDFDKVEWLRRICKP